MLIFLKNKLFSVDLYKNFVEGNKKNLMEESDIYESLLLD